MFNKLLIVILSVFSVSAYAQEAVVIMPHWTVGVETFTVNTKLSDANLKDWRTNEEVTLQYAFTPNFFVDGALVMMHGRQFGYKLGAGFEVPGDYFTPYTELTFDEARSHNGYLKKGADVDYDVGISFVIPKIPSVHLMAELDDMIMTQESAKVGVGYTFDSGIGVESDYWIALNNKSNGADVEMTYSF